jgi:hypothetical protein
VPVVPPKLAAAPPPPEELDCAPNEPKESFSLAALPRAKGVFVGVLFLLRGVVPLLPLLFLAQQILCGFQFHKISF